MFAIPISQNNRLSPWLHLGWSPERKLSHGLAVHISMKKVRFPFLTTWELRRGIPLNTGAVASLYQKGHSDSTLKNKFIFWGIISKKRKIPNTFSINDYTKKECNWIERRWISLKCHHVLHICYIFVVLWMIYGLNNRINVFKTSD